ncbi:MAG: cobalamin biosynthesis protein CobG [Janibacter sp.]|nr:cobalamin biosynthesis protein CobG [Janibacter sp.]
MSTPSPSRSGADRCPGLLAPFVSADGAMVRLRLPGGRVDAATVGEISSLARRFGDPDVTLTSRGSLQLRGLPDPLPHELITAIDDLRLVPSGEHDKARNIVADPSPGLDELVGALDAGLLADPGLAHLPGRFLLAVGRPSGPVLGEPWDIAIVDETLPEVRGTSLEGTARVVVDGHSVLVPRDEAPELALDVARRFLAARSDARTWNIRDLPVDARATLLPEGTPFVVPAAEPPLPGPDGDNLVALVPLGLLTPAMAAAIAPSRGSSQGSSHLDERGDVQGSLHLSERVVITPWRSIVVPGGAARVDELAAAGFATAPDSPWTVLTACAGAPACARTTTATRDLARDAAPVVDPAGPPVHVIGCERSCGHPARAHTVSLNPSTVADVVAAQRSPNPERSS